MNNLPDGFVSSRARAARSDALRRAVQGALRVSVSAAMAAALSVAPNARAGVFPAEIELSSLLPGNGGDGSAGLVLNGIDDTDYTGSAVSEAGDVNGDGIGDFLIASERRNQTHGETYVVFGRDVVHGETFPAEIELSSLLPANGGNGSAGFVLPGIDGGDRSGWSVSAAGDVNGDGIGDLIIGAPGGDPGGRPHAGESYVVFGRDTGQTGPFPAVFDLSSLFPANGGDGSDGFALSGIRPYDGAGDTVSAAGDLNGDGIDDLVIGAPYSSPYGRPGAGQSYVVFGRDTAQAGAFPAIFTLATLLPNQGGDGSAGFVMNGVGELDYSGFSFASGGDINGDGIADLIVGAALASPAGQPYAGRSYVVFGRDTAQAGSFPAVIELSSLLSANGGDGSTGFALNGIGFFYFTGGSVSTGDVNGDGYDDVVIGAGFASPGGRTYAGEAYVLFGRETTQVGNFPAEIELASLRSANGGDGSTGFVLNGIDPGDGSGLSVDAATDVNGDGITDLVIGAAGSDPGGLSYAGETYVVFGRDAAQVGSFPAELELASLLTANGGDGSVGFVLNGIEASDFSGVRVAAGDVSADGVGDLIVGARVASPGGRPFAGQSYVVFGRKDSDGDSIADAADNCSLVANADQRDSNGDGYGNACDPDLDNNGIVNFSDLGLLKNVFFSADPDADFNGDGAVNFSDLGTMKAFFFLPPGPSGVVTEGDRAPRKGHIALP